MATVSTHIFPPRRATKRKSELRWTAYRNHKNPYEPSKQVFIRLKEGKFARKVRRRAMKRR